jgi:hypothetical protein
LQKAKAVAAAEEFRQAGVVQDHGRVRFVGLTITL